MADFLDPRGFNSWQEWANEVQQQGFVTLADVNNIIGDGATPVWGTITGSLASQTDLQTALNGKQAVDGDLTAIAALAGTTGLLRKTALDTWSLDTAAYLTGNQTVTLSGDISGSGATAITTAIGANKVTNAMLAQVATASFKGRTTAGTGNVEDLTATQATALLNAFTTTLKGLAPASGGGTTNFLRADGTWAAPAGTGTNVSYTASTRAVASSTGTGFTFPLFTSTEAGLAPLSGGGTTNFLRADGTWAAPSVGGVAWGSITGTLSSQTDLNTALNARLLDTGDTMTGQLVISGVAHAIKSNTGTRGGGNNYFSFYDSTGEKGHIGYGASDDRFNLWNITNANMVFGTNNTTRMTILAGGNVQIGPGQVDDTTGVTVAASAGVGAGISLYETSSGGTNRLRIYQTTGEVIYNATWGTGGNVHVFQIGNTEAARITSGKLTVGRSGYGSASLDQGDNATYPGYIAFTTPNGTRRGYIGWASGSRLTLTAENSWNWYVGGGYLTVQDIFTACPGGSWTTSGWGRGLTLPQSYAIQWLKGAYSYSWGMGESGDNMYFTRSAADDNSSLAYYWLTITGSTMDATFYANVTAYSDFRKKKDIHSAYLSLEDMLLVRPIEYTHIDTERRSCGVVAQELEEVLPLTVIEDSEGFKSVDYGRAAIMMVTSLAREVSELKQQVRKLNG